MPMHTGFLEKCEFKIISVMKLKLQDMTAQSLSLIGAPRINRNIFETFFLTFWRKDRLTIAFLTHL
jgi:hypothetical protein